MPAGRVYGSGRRSKPVAAPRPRRTLGKQQAKQVRSIAKQQIRLRAETKQRAWLYPKTTYSELQHNKMYKMYKKGCFKFTLNKQKEVNIGHELSINSYRNPIEI